MISKAREKRAARAGAAQGQRGERQAEDERQDNPGADQLQMTPELLRKFGAMSGKFPRERKIGESALMGHQREAGRERGGEHGATRQRKPGALRAVQHGEQRDRNGDPEAGAE
jgi:hypothetical protein